MTSLPVAAAATEPVAALNADCQIAVFSCVADPRVLLMKNLWQKMPFKNIYI